MSSNFLVWRPGSMKDGICKLVGLANVPKSFKLLNGESRASEWPTDASAAMDPRFAQDIGLADSLYGTGFFVLSARVKQFLDGENLRNVEWLPLVVINHKGRAVPETYQIFNPMELVDCIDKEKSAVTYDAIKPTVIDGCAQLVLREDAIPPDVHVFRPSNWRKITLVRRELADRMMAAGFTGYRLEEPSKYTGLT